MNKTVSFDVQIVILRLLATLFIYNYIGRCTKNMLNYSDSCLAPTVGFAGETFASALQFFAAAQCLIAEHPPPDANVPNCTTFDFIIVGAGTAGSVVANRLSEVNKWNILLIEAGDDAPIESTVPEMHSHLFNTKYDWQYKTTSNGKTNNANINGSVNWIRGKMLGGTSSINGMIYYKGSDYDFQTWNERNEGNNDWNVKIAERYSKKAESLQDAILIQNPVIKGNYGEDGPLVINSFNCTYRPYTARVLKSWKELGIENVPDIYSNNMRGSGFVRTTASGVRYSTSKAYLDNISNRTNIKVLKRSLVTKILMDKSNKAYGVEVDKNGVKLFFYANLEIIVSAGVINTPQLLMLSGIGPKDHLEAYNIDCKVELPAVGQYLKDHLTVPVTVYANEPKQLDEGKKMFQAIQYLYDRQGYLSDGTLTEINAFYSVNETVPYTECQNHLSIFPRNSPKIKKIFTEVLNYKPTVVDSILELSKENALFYFQFNLLQPFSKGNISLASNNPKDYPIIYPNYLEDPRDLQTTVKGLKVLSKIVNTKPFKKMNSFLGRIKWPECDDLELDSEEYWQCIALNMVVTAYHPTSSCRMGPDSKTAVVNSRLKVHDVDGLRIIDASAMPIPSTGNPMGVIIMMAERGADLIKQDYNIPLEQKR